MGRTLLLFFFLLAAPIFLLANDQHRGYLVTKSGMELTGFIGKVTYGALQTSVVFINDFGTSYNIHPALVRGFVYRNGPELVSYQSYYYDQQWHFLRIISQGEHMTLYQAPVQRTTLAIKNGQVTPDTYSQREYFLESRSGRILRIGRLGFRKQLKRAFRQTAPELARKIGTPGYRFKDMHAIVEEYNVLCAQTRL